MKPKPKDKTLKIPIRLTKSDNHLISIIMNESKCKTRTEAVRMGLILAAQQYGNINSIIMPASIKKITKIKKPSNK